MADKLKWHVCTCILIKGKSAGYFHVYNIYTTATLLADALSSAVLYKAQK
jgi:hypothetical protein